MTPHRRAAVLDAVPHGFFGREGGVSAGTVAGLNVGLGTGDDPAAVAENRRRVVEAVAPGTALVTLYQVHSGEAVAVEAPFPADDRPRADGMATRTPGLLLGILTADCAPVLLADHEAGVVGAAHAGWRGAHGGVLEATVERMVGLGAERGRIVAAIGPCIAQASYEVDEAFHARLIAEAGDNARHFAPAPSTARHLFDLEGYAAGRLARAGVGTIERMGIDTYSDDARYFSFRRATHRGEPDYGRQIAVIALGG